eukprot:CAMPEP_0181036372 /NCGR_PEP_ID=MMETSP1070-20121207/8819_1 /TAXON_ID=265543 /ORGANISM="Minutocellus polymorphus, Strain NH13" /LENGTH=148 /DNA_ID=CAMNT_0023113989 /DNA_START=427 /DNA_END=873 /DNA_ORIENTATION=+
MFGRKPAARPAARSAAPARKPAATPAPQAAAPPAVPQQQSGGMLSGIGSTIAQGMAFGTGSAIAHRAVGAAAGALSGGDDEAGAPVEYAAPADHVAAPAPATLEGPCAQDKQMFYECLQVNRGDQEACRFLYDTLQTCSREQSSMNFS